MKRSRFTEEQVVAILREQEAGIATADLCRKHGISTATFYAWKAKFGGMDVSEAKRLKSLEDENAKLKRLLADAMLDNVALKDLLQKNSDARRQARGCRASRSHLRDERASGVSRLSRRIARRSGTKPGGPQTPIYVFACANWLPSSGGSAIGVCTCSCAVKAMS